MFEYREIYFVLLQFVILWMSVGIWNRSGLSLRSDITAFTFINAYDHMFNMKRSSSGVFLGISFTLRQCTVTFKHVWTTTTTRLSNVCVLHLPWFMLHWLKFCFINNTTKIQKQKRSHTIWNLLYCLWSYFWFSLPFSVDSANNIFWNQF